MDHAAEIVDQIHSQRIPWEVEVLVMAPKGRFDFPSTRIFKPRNVNKPLDVMDYAIQRSNSDIVVFVNGNTIPQGDKSGFWESRIRCLKRAALESSIVPQRHRKSPQRVSPARHSTAADSGDGSNEMEGKAFAVRKSVALKNSFDAESKP